MGIKYNVRTVDAEWGKAEEVVAAREVQTWCISYSLEPT